MKSPCFVVVQIILYHFMYSSVYIPIYIYLCIMLVNIKKMKGADRISVAYLAVYCPDE